MKRAIGGDRIGSGDKMNVEMKTYSRSTHNLGYKWRSTMAAGTLVPFMKILALPGDTFDIDLNCDVMTHPTIGPLFGEYKIELHIFEAPIRLYQAMLHNNALNIGMKMNTVKLPVMKLQAETNADIPEDIDNSQINPSCILSYLGIRGVGIVPTGVAGKITREFNAIPWLGYWDIVKNYYANKQEEIGYVVHSEKATIINTVDSIDTDNGTVDEYPAVGLTLIGTAPNDQIVVNFTGATPDLTQIVVNVQTYGNRTLEELRNAPAVIGAGTITIEAKGIYEGKYIFNWQYNGNNVVVNEEIKLVEFPLENIDNMRNALLNNAGSTAAKVINDLNIGAPYDLLLDWMATDSLSPYTSTQEGLAIKTYDSDKLNNWMSTEWIEGPGGISEITAIDTSGGSFTIDTIVMARKVYNMLNRIALSGGSYKDWIETVYTDNGHWMCSTPMYHGGLIRDIVFQEVVSNSESVEGAPLGTLAGKGIMGREKKGGSITIKVNEPGYIIGLVSITPKIDYSQGNEWDIHLKAMDELHAPEMDAIGFQDLITEEFAWWDTNWDDTEQEWIQKSAGKQPAWINYMTNINKTYGNFAIENNEMFMTLNRRYENDEITGEIKDLTTYIDPSKYNFIFAQTSLDSQNFWVQIGVRNEARRLMSGKVMPNL